MKTKIEYTIECLPEDLEIRGSFASGDDEADEQLAQEIERDLERGNEWAWCCVKVVCTLTRSGEKFIGVDYLGGCSYKDEKDFSTPDGYLPQMKREAYSDAIASLNSAIVRGNIAKETQEEVL